MSSTTGTTSHKGWVDKLTRLQGVLSALEITDAQGARLAPDEGYARWVALTERVREADRSLFLVGNGASASMASHFCCDLGKNARVNTQVFTDPAFMTAVGNDISYEQVFASPLEWRGRPGDMLVAISSSGRSPNILAAARVAREKGLAAVTLSAMGEDNPLRGLGELNFYVPARTYGDAETSHAAILHHWCDALVE